MYRTIFDPLPEPLTTSHDVDRATVKPPREAYGVRGACSRFRCGQNVRISNGIRKREQAPRTPYASRGSAALRLARLAGHSGIGTSLNSRSTNSERGNASGARARLRLRVTAAAEKAVRGGHPWVFDASIREQNRPGELGELA